MLVPHDQDSLVGQQGGVRSNARPFQSTQEWFEFRARPAGVSIGRGVVNRKVGGGVPTVLGLSGGPQIILVSFFFTLCDVGVSPDQSRSGLQ